MPLSGAATDLQTKTGIVNVSSANAPSSGQVLTATGATAATWQTSAGGSVTYNSESTSRDLSTASGNQTIAHGLGTTPKYIRMTMMVTDGTSKFGQSTGSWNGSQSSSIFSIDNGITAISVSTNGHAGNFITTISTDQTLTNFNQASVSADGTNITLAWTKTGTPTGTCFINWEAWG